MWFGCTGPMSLSKNLQLQLIFSCKSYFKVDFGHAKISDAIFQVYTCVYLMVQNFDGGKFWRMGIWKFWRKNFDKVSNVTAHIY